MRPFDPPEPATPGVGAVNTDAWARAGRWTVLSYARTRALRPAEAAIFQDHGRSLTGRTLELGCGAGRVTRHLIANGADVDGIDVSPAMVRHCSRACPGARVAVGDMRDLRGFDEESFASVVAAYNVMDVFDDLERGATLAGIRRVLQPGGILVFSTHNLAWAEAVGIPGPTAVRRGDPLRMAYDMLRVPRRVRNHRRLRALERREPGYAILNDSGFDFAVLHYYVGHERQVEQLAAAGFDWVACYVSDGTRRPLGAPAPESPDLHFVATRSGTHA